MTNEPLSDAELAELERLYAAATARTGKWHNSGGDVRDEHDHNVAEVCDDVPWKRNNEYWTPAEMELGRKKLSAQEIIAVGDSIIAMHNAFPRLLATIRQERERCASIADGFVRDVGNASDQDAAYEISLRNEAAEGIAETIRNSQPTGNTPPSTT